MSNYIASSELNGGGFGGSSIVDHNGEIIKARTLFEEGLIIWDQSTE